MSNKQRGLPEYFKCGQNQITWRPGLCLGPAGGADYSTPPDPVAGPIVVMAKSQ